MVATLPSEVSFSLALPPEALAALVEALDAFDYAMQAMNRFRKLGFVDYNQGSLEVHSSLLNVVLAE